MVIDSYRSLIALYVLVKLLYIVAFYNGLGEAFNVGDTLAFSELKFIDRQDYSSFAFIMSLGAYFVNGKVYLYDLVFLFYQVVLMARVKLYAKPVLVQVLLIFGLLSPPCLVFLSVYSKEMLIFVFLSVSVFYRVGGVFGTLFVCFFLLWARPSFVMFYLFLKASWFQKNVNLSFLMLISAYLVLILLLVFYGDSIRYLYSKYLTNFSSGSSTYSYFSFSAEELFFQFWSRLFVLQGVGDALVPFLGFYMAAMIYFLCVAATRGSSLYLLVLMGVSLLSLIPYGIHNPGAYMRFAAPLVACLFYIIGSLEPRVARV